MKMTKKFDKLNETFNVDGDIIPVESETIIEKVEKISLAVDDVKKDYDYTRGNLYSLIEKGQVKYIVKESKKFFSCSNPDNLMNPLKATEFMVLDLIKEI